MKNITKRFLLLAAILSLACTTKVSEWFLLNAAPDKYLLVYYHKDPIPEPVIRNHTEFQAISKSANIVFRSALKENIDKPYYTLYYNNRVFLEYADYDEIKGLITSPFREKIATELLSGKLCTMLYLKCGSKEKDEAGLQILRNTVKSSPFGDVISIMELDRNNLDEKQLVTLLLHVESDLKGIQEPMLFGVFGRFRVLEPLLAKGISAENINLMINFLTADCSCLIKDNLPGVSMLCNADWENPQPAMVNAIIDRNPHLAH